MNKFADRKRGKNIRARRQRACLVDALEQRTLFAVNPSVVDLLVAYTPAALNYIGGDANKMTNKIRRMVADADSALVNSQINASFRIVGIMQTSYTGDAAGATSQSVVAAAEATGQGFDDVNAMKTSVGADDVLLVANTNNGGYTESNPGYSVIYPKAMNQDVGVHELGHELGGGHTRARDGVPTGNGVAWDSTVSIGGITLGEVFSGRDINYFSNPNITFRGQSLGVPDSASNAADNASAMNAYAPTAAARQNQAVAVTTGPTAGLGLITNVSGQTTIKFKVIYYDGAGVDVTTLGNSNINVTGPNSFSGSATFVGIDTQQNTGPAPVTASSWNTPVVTADYSITVPSVGDLSTYSFTLGSSPVQNIGGVAASGPLLDASGDAGVSGGPAQPPLLPQYAGGDIPTNTPVTSRPIGLAAELGNISGQSIVLNDNGSGYFANDGQGTALYHFTLANPGVVSFNTGLVLSSDTRSSYQSGSSLAAGDYYLQVSTAGPFTLKLTATAITAPTGTISGFGYQDDDKNGLYDPNNEYRTPETIKLTGTDITGNPVNLSTTNIGITPLGTFSFTNVPLSNAAGYTLTWVSQIPGFNVPGAGSITGSSPGMAQGFGSITGITLTTAGQTLSGYNLATITKPAPANISGNLWSDSNGNGILDNGESNIAGVTLTLTGTDISGNAVNLTTTSTASGFTFSNVAAANGAGYTITAPVIPGLVPGAFAVGNSGGTVNAISNSIGGVKLLGSNATGYNFPFITAPVNTSTPVAPPVSMTVNQGGTTSGNVLNGATTVNTLFDYSGGFANATLASNGTTTIVNGNQLQLDDNSTGFSAGSSYYATPVNVTKFASQFTFTFAAGANTADGLTFVIQNMGSTALGQTAGNLGYAGIGKSVAVKFDLYSNNGEGPSSTGLYTNGATPFNVGSVDLTASNVDLHSGDPMQVNMTYGGATLVVTIRDTVNGNSNTQNYPVNIPAIVGANTAYVGFTGANGGVNCQPTVTAWTFSNTEGKGSTTSIGAALARDSVTAKAAPRVSKAKRKNGGLTAALETPPSHAANFSIDANGNFTYTPLPGFVGTDTFAFACVNTTTHRCANDVTTVTIKVRKADQPPARNDEIALSANTATNQAMEIDLRSYVTDPDTAIDKLHFRRLKAQNGTARLLADGHTVLFKPKAGFNGSASFTFVASDGIKHSAPLQFSVNVEPPATPLSISDIYAPIFPGLEVGIPWRQFVSDTDAAAAIALEAIGSQPLHGTAVVKNQKLFYTPGKGLVTNDYMTIQLRDSDGNTTTGRVYLQSRQG